MRTATRLSRLRWTPLGILALVCLASLLARGAWLTLPCRSSCRTPAAHLLIFDERYYVNAARVIAGIRPAAVAGAAYRHAPLGSDPNAEHPQLAKLIMAGSIELLGDGPWAWRLGSLIFGTLAVGAMFALARSAGGGPWLAVGAAALMAADNLMIIQGRIGTLEVYVVAAMICSMALYLRGHPMLAGVTAGIGACMKLFALDVVAVMALFELLRWRQTGVSQIRLRRLGLAAAATAGSLVGLLAVLDRIAPPYDNAARRYVQGGPLDHLAHMISYGVHQTGFAGAGGITSYPWQWLVDYKPIVYLGIDPAQPGNLRGAHPTVHFLGLISPPILIAALIGMALALWATVVPRPVRDALGSRRLWRALLPRRLWRKLVARRVRSTLAPGQLGRAASPRRLLGVLGARAPAAAQDREVAALCAAWFLGTLGPFVLASLLGRTTYLYYMAIVMPGMYLAAAWLASRLRQHTGLFWGWVALVVAAAVVLYPFTPLP